MLLGCLSLSAFSSLIFLVVYPHVCQLLQAGSGLSTAMALSGATHNIRSSCPCA